MEKKPMMYKQRMIDFDAPKTEEQTHVAQATSEPPPAANQEERKTLPLVRPDRQLTYGGAAHYEWPDAIPLHDRDTLTVDRIADDIDGPAHRFVIKRGDAVEVYLSRDKFHVGEVIGISHANEEVRVAWDETREKGGWFHVGRIYPAPEPEPKRSPGQKRLSKIIEGANARNGAECIEADRVPKPLPKFTFDDFKAFYERFRRGEASFEEYKENFARLLAKEAPMKAELLSRFKAKELSLLASRFGSWNAKRSTKEENALAIYHRMLSSFALDGIVSYSMGERYEVAVRRKVEAVTFEDYEQAFSDRRTKAAEEQKALSNPETFFEFRTFLSRKSEAELNDEQLAHYDSLHADMTRETRASEITRTVEQFQSNELQGYEFQIKKGYHDKRHCPVWIVQLSTRVERATFEELNRKAKMLGGWYSSFKKADAGFQFLELEGANRFAALLSGDADRSDILEARKERRELSASERLHELAAELALRAEESIERSNASLQNTARRADIQAGVRGRAYSDQALAKTMHSISEALSRGEAKYLDGIRHKTHIETLDSVLYLAKWARVRAVRKQAGESGYSHERRRDRIEDEPIGPQDIRFAEYPYPQFYKRHLEDLVARALGVRGVKQAALKMQKRLTREKEDSVTFRADHDLEALTDFVGRAKAAGFNVERIEESCQKYSRLQRANVKDIHELRAALREYLAHRAEARGDDPVKVAERELIGKKLPGFFPTPPAVIERMLELAEIGPQHSVLEPSCGKGDIVDAIKREHPGVTLHAIEMNQTLSEVLSAKGQVVEFGDFLQHRETYDRIVMNPPFELGQDIEHVRHAFSLLHAGGRIVSVMSEGTFFRSDKQSAEFRDWLKTVAAETESLPDDAFTGKEAFRETSVRTRLVTIDKD